MKFVLVLIVSLAATVLAVLDGGGIANAAGAMRSEDRWNPQHIDSLPAEIRSAIAPYARLCGGALAAEHLFARYLDKGDVKLVGLHFEHLRCGEHAKLCTAAGCLHQVYISTGGRYRLLKSFHTPELDLSEFRSAPAR